MALCPHLRIAMKSPYSMCRGSVFSKYRRLKVAALSAGIQNKRTATSAVSGEYPRRPRGFPGGLAKHNNEMWTLSTTQVTQGVMLILPEDIGLYNDVISRWESVTLNLLSEKTFNDNKSKMTFIENCGDFPGGPVVKTLGFHYREHGFHPWSGS